MAIITEKWNKIFEEAYLDDILRGLEEIQKENNYTDEEMDNDLQVALWRAYVYNNMDSYEYYELSEKTLAKKKWIMIYKWHFGELMFTTIWIPTNIMSYQKKHLLK